MGDGRGGGQRVAQLRTRRCLRVPASLGDEQVVHGLGGRRVAEHHASGGDEELVESTGPVVGLLGGCRQQLRSLPFEEVHRHGPHPVELDEQGEQRLGLWAGRRRAGHRVRSWT
jgi:hypothetical protein